MLTRSHRASHRSLAVTFLASVALSGCGVLLSAGNSVECSGERPIDPSTPVELTAGAASMPHGDPQRSHHYPVDLGPGGRVGDGLEEVWAVEVQGEVSSGIAIAENIMVVEGFCTVYAIDLETQETRWAINWGNSAWRTPIIVDGVVLLRFPSGIRALDVRTGDRLWEQTNIAELRHQESVVESGLVFVLGESLHAYDVQTGEERWSQHVGQEGQPRRRRGLVAADGLVVAGDVGTGRLVAYEATTGQVAWDVGNVDNAVPLTVFEGTLLMTSGVDEDECHVTAINAATGAERWSATICDVATGQRVRDAGAAHGRFYVAAEWLGIVAVDVATGDQLWTGPAHPLPPEETLTITDHAVYVTDSQGISAFEPSTGALLGRHELPERANAPVVPYGDLLIVPQPRGQRVVALR